MTKKTMDARRMLVLVLLLAVQATTFAQLSTLTLKNGSVMRGYIAVQHPGRDIVFRTVEAMVYVDNTEFTDIEEKFVYEDALTMGWAKWASDNGLETRNGRKGLTLCTLTNGDETHRLVKIKERGATIKYEQHSNDNYTLDWSDIQKIVRDNAEMSSQQFFDNILLDDGTSYTGVVTEQRPGLSTTIKLRNGDVRVLRQSEIRSSKKIARSIDVDLWEVRPYTNTIVFDDGSEHRGIIVNQYVGYDAYDSYVELYKPDGTQERINFIDIEEYRNEPCEPLGKAE